MSALPTCFPEHRPSEVHLVRRQTTLVVVLGSLLLALGLVELIKRLPVLRGFFGIKARRREMPSTETE